MWRCQSTIVKNEIIARKYLKPLQGKQDINDEIKAHSYHAFYDSRVPIEISLDRLGDGRVNKQVKEFLVQEFSENEATKSATFKAWLCFKAEFLIKTKNNHKIRLTASPTVDKISNKVTNPYHCHADLVTTFDGKEEALTKLPDNFETLGAPERRALEKLERTNVHTTALHLQSIYNESGFLEEVEKFETKKGFFSNLLNAVNELFSKYVVHFSSYNK